MSVYQFTSSCCNCGLSVTNKWICYYLMLCYVNVMWINRATLQRHVGSHSCLLLIFYDSLLWMATNTGARTCAFGFSLFLFTFRLLYVCILFNFFMPVGNVQCGVARPVMSIGKFIYHLHTMLHLHACLLYTSPSPRDS